MLVEKPDLAANFSCFLAVKPKLFHLLANTPTNTRACYEIKRHFLFSEIIENRWYIQQLLLVNNGKALISKKSNLKNWFVVDSVI